MEKAHKKLNVWQEAMQLAKEIYQVTSGLPESEKYGLISQMRKAAVSIPSNIAEGAARQSDRQSLQFYTIARGSLSELDTQIELCALLGMLTGSQTRHIEPRLNAVDGLLSGLIRFTRKKRTSK
ncbi:MAG: four helix bundle protein [Ignavibacteria bacterium]|nr:four helix bundle protein [Ignavibacteria bacterium]